MALSQSDLVRRVTQSLSTGDRRGFRTAIADLVAIDADLGRSWQTVTEPLISYGEFDLAVAAIDRFVRWSRATPASRFAQATVYARAGRPTQAQAVLAQIDRAVPDRAAHAFLRGSLALNLGDVPAARAAMIETLQAHPLSGQAAYALAASGSMAIDHAAADHILAGASRVDDAVGDDRAMYLYAIGKLYADRGDSTQAFDHYARGAALIAASRRYDRAADRLGATSATEGWDAATIAAVSDRVTARTARPIMVTGLPRSGTTLVEQILVSHSAVGGGDELGYLAMLVNEIGGPMADPARLLVKGGRPDAVAEDYGRLLDIRFGRDDRIVDKTLEATRYLGTAAALLPDAPLLYVRRKPLARAWSCFSTYFVAGLEWTFDQAAIAAHFRLEEALLVRWQDILGDRLMVVEYEDLVTNKAVEIPRLLDHVGLGVEPATLNPETTARLVRTASVVQVRAPVSTTRVDAADAYRTHLQPFIDAYTAAGGTID